MSHVPTNRGCLFFVVFAPSRRSSYPQTAARNGCRSRRLACRSTMLTLSGRALDGKYRTYTCWTLARLLDSCLQHRCPHAGFDPPPPHVLDIHGHVHQELDLHGARLDPVRTRPRLATVLLPSTILYTIWPPSPAPKHRRRPRRCPYLTIRNHAAWTCLGRCPCSWHYCLIKQPTHGPRACSE